MPPTPPGDAENWLICTSCGTQFPTADRSVVKTCFVCDDARQFVPSTGQSFTTHAELAASHANELVAHPRDRRLVSIVTRPKFAIGQRAVLVRTPAGNVLWDCVSLVDDRTVAAVAELGGLEAIVISHPHYYTTHVLWARAFGCPVYIAAEDEGWTTMGDEHHVLVGDVETQIAGTGALAIKLGGHFPGSMVLLFDRRLFVADTLVTTPAGLGAWHVDAEGRPRSKPPGLNSFAFFWSIPNMIPLSADDMARMWRVLKRYHFTATHGAFLSTDIEDEGIKGRVLASMQIQARSMGNAQHSIMNETC